MQPKISIIVPTYNVEKYLSRCLNSILAQTFRDFELLLINDGSTDASGSICDDYVRRDKRIKVIHKCNGGVGSARNTALDIAQGTYIGFVDPDDWIAEDFYETLYNAALSSNADISISSFYIFTEENLICNHSSPSRSVFKDHECIEMFLQAKYPFIPCYMWNKLFKANLFKTVRFDETLAVLEDEDVIYLLLLQRVKVMYIDKPMYFYFIRDNSALHTSFDMNKKLNLISVARKVVQNTKQYQQQYLALSYVKYMQTFQKVLIEILQNDFNTYKITYYHLSQELNQKYFTLLFNNYLTIKQKIHLTMLKFCPAVYKCYICYRTQLVAMGGAEQSANSEFNK